MKERAKKDISVNIAPIATVISFFFLLTLASMMFLWPIERATALNDESNLFVYMHTTNIITPMTTVGNVLVPLVTILVWSGLIMFAFRIYEVTQFNVGIRGLAILTVLMVAMIGAHVFIGDGYQKETKKMVEEKNLQLAAEKANADAAAAEHWKFLQTLPSCHAYIKTTKIYSLERNNEVTGSASGEMHGSASGLFVLGFGGVSGSVSGSYSAEQHEVTKYYFFTETKDGGAILSSALSMETPIYERDDIEPALLEVVVNETDGVNCNSQIGYSVVPYHGVAFDISYVRGNYEGEGSWTASPKYKLVVPTNTIKREYKPN